MLSILALIGKIILIIILTILIVLLSLVTILLFVPVRYRGNGRFNVYEKPNYQCDLSLSWLLHLIHVRFYTVEDENVLVFRIFGIKDSSYKKFFSIFKRKSSKNEKLKKNKNTDHDTASRVSGFPNDIKEDNEQDVVLEAAKSDVNENLNEKINDNDIDDQTANLLKDHENIDSKNEKRKNKFSLETLKKLLKDGDKLKKKIKRYYKILTSDVCKDSFQLCKDRLLKIIKYILPRKAKVNVYFGFDDPSVTGNILAIHGILYALVSDIIILHPNFDDEMFYGDFKLKGKIRLCTLLYHILRIYFDENCKRFYRIIKKEMNHGR